METILAGIGTALGSVMRLCYNLCNSYGGAILLFTLLTKIILLPLSIWVQRNSIKVVRMQPALDRIHIAHYGDADAISEAQAQLYKKEKYNPLASLIPLFVQILILMGVVEVIYHPLTYLLALPAQQLEMWIAAAGLDPAVSSAQLNLMSIIAANGTDALAAQLGEAAAIAPQIVGFDTTFLGVDLTWVASQMSLVMLWIPLATGASALLLALMQNRLNPLQHEQGKGMQIGTMLFSVGISLYLGYFVPAGVALYWVASNLYTIVQQLLLNRILDPKKFVDYAELEKNRKELAALEALDRRDDPHAKTWHKQEKADYKRFFSVANKHLVFYSESQGFYKYFAPVIEEILKRSNLTVHYITSDPEDAILERTEPRLKTYYIGPKKLITLFMKMDADVVVMTLSDLDNYHYKRSYVRKDIRYIYMFHYPLSTHMVLHTGALDHYDQILCVGDFQIPEIRAAEKLYHTPEKELTVCGYCQLDELYHGFEKAEYASHTRKRILVAPSWQEGNILDSCIDGLLDGLLGHDWDVVVRPHPEYVKRYAPRMEALMARWKDRERLTFETDFTSNASIWESDVVITDWSGTGTEFAFVTLRPCVFIDTPPKVNNPDYVKLGIEPQELRLRDHIGLRIAMADADKVGARLPELLDHANEWTDKIRKERDSLIANFPNSAPASAKAILSAVVSQAAKN